MVNSLQHESALCSLLSGPVLLVTRVTFLSPQSHSLIVSQSHSLPVTVSQSPLFAIAFFELRSFSVGGSVGVGIGGTHHSPLFPFSRHASRVTRHYFVSPSPPPLSSEAFFDHRSFNVGCSEGVGEG